MEHTFTVGAGESGERLDKWLCTKLRSFSRGQIKKLLDGGRVLINGRRVVIAGWELEPDDSVEVRIPPDFGTKDNGQEVQEPAHRHPVKPNAPSEVAAADTHHKQPIIRDSIERHIAKRKTPAPATPAASGRGERKGERKEEYHRERPGRLKIYLEDRDLIVVEKPAGILSVPSEGKGMGGGNLLDEIKSYLKRRHSAHKHSFVAPLHRLDAETSGVMVFALSKAGQALERQFRDHTIRREYTAVVSGRIEQKDGVIDIPLEKGEFGGGKKVRTAEADGGKRAVTEFRVKERYGATTLLELRVRTGRTHQIRVHLSELGFPLIGDKIYSREGGQQGPAFQRHALHAHLLGFRHPVTGKKHMFHSSLPHDMRELIDGLRQG